jgi:hypothetical protein
MRVGVVSPNLLSNVADDNAMSDDPNMPWPFEVLAKRASMLFDRLYLTEDLDLTCEIVGGGSAICDDDPYCATLRYLADKDLILLPQHLGYASGAAFLQSNLKGEGRRLHAALLKVGNPSNNCEPGEYTYVGQPDIGDLEAHDGNHPRSHKGDKDPQIAVKKRRYESLLVRRNVALLRQAGCSQVTVVGDCPTGRAANASHPVWSVVLHEMPDFNTRAPWEDVLGFRAEPKTQHLIRSIRRWIRKIVTEEWTHAELEDEVRELLYEYERHLRYARFAGARGILKCTITGSAEITEDIIKLRLSKLASLVTAVLDRKAIMSTADAQAPGRELALISELKTRFH